MRASVRLITAAIGALKKKIKDWEKEEDYIEIKTLQEDLKTITDATN